MRIKVFMLFLVISCVLISSSFADDQTGHTQRIWGLYNACFVTNPWVVDQITAEGYNNIFESIATNKTGPLDLTYDMTATLTKFWAQGTFRRTWVWSGATHDAMDYFSDIEIVPFQYFPATKKYNLTNLNNDYEAAFQQFLEHAATYSEKVSYPDMNIIITLYDFHSSAWYPNQAYCQSDTGGSSGCGGGNWGNPWYAHNNTNYSHFNLPTNSNPGCDFFYYDPWNLNPVWLAQKAYVENIVGLIYDQYTTTTERERIILEFIHEPPEPDYVNNICTEPGDISKVIDWYDAMIDFINSLPGGSDLQKAIQINATDNVYANHADIGDLDIDNVTAEMGLTDSSWWECEGYYNKQCNKCETHVSDFLNGIKNLFFINDYKIIVDTDGFGFCRNDTTELGPAASAAWWQGVSFSHDFDEMVVDPSASSYPNFVYDFNSQNVYLETIGNHYN